MSLARRTLLVAGLVMAASSATHGQAAGGSKSKFTQSAFEAAQVAGKPILVDVSAPWCPTCRTQAPIINSLLTKPEFKDVSVFQVDFDSQKDVLKALNVRSQSTLITFKGKSEVSRTIGETKADVIERQLKAAI
jgi:thioredoxin 1